MAPPDGSPEGAEGDAVSCGGVEGPGAAGCPVPLEEGAAGSAPPDVVGALGVGVTVSGLPVSGFAAPGLQNAALVRRLEVSRAAATVSTETIVGSTTVPLLTSTVPASGGG